MSLAMHLDVQDLRNFYYRSALGRAAQASIRDRLVGVWPEAKGLTVLGFGFAVPMLRPYLKDARRVIALMPGPQGVMPWPSQEPNIAALTEETLWPIETGHIDRLVVLHGLETSDRPGDLLDECWRVLGPGGRAIFIVPNRAGLWCRSDGTPFGYGRPYTLGQLETQLKKHHFLPEHSLPALYQPPWPSRFWMRSGPLCERMGARLPSVLPGGVFMVEASKRVHPPRGTRVRDTAKRPVEALDGFAEPAIRSGGPPGDG